jgi:spermidine synthase
MFLLLGFQAVYGYVYTELAILIGLFMAGIALGSRLAMPRAAASTRGRLIAVQLLLGLAVPMLLLAIALQGRFFSGAAAWIAAQIAFPALATICGLLGGYQFVIAGGVFLRERSGRTGLGALYAIDLLGGCVAALVLTTFLIPVFGFWRTAWLAAAVNMAAVLVATRASLPTSRVARDA